jgi:transcriptional regulator of acetoin/glycerol metabolism
MAKLRVEPRLVDALVRHEYRLHTRELQRLLEVAVATSRGEYLSLTEEVTAELGASSQSTATTAAGSLPPPAEELSRVLMETGGNVTQAAQRLGLSRYAVHRLIKNHGLARKFE